MGQSKWLHLPRRTVRLRLTALYGALFLASGTGLLAITYGLIAGHHLPTSFAVVKEAGGSVKGVPVPFPKKASVVALEKFSSCMRAHGIRHFPEPKISFGGASISYALRNGGLANGPRFAAATEACGRVTGVNGAFVAPKGGRLSLSGFTGLVTNIAATLPTPGELHRIVVESGLALAIMAFASIGLGWLMAGRALRPLREMTNAARHISEQNLHQRLAVRGPADELKDLGDTIDGLLGRLETAFEAQRRFVANASHELRTPMAMLRTSLDVALGKPGPSADVKVLAGKLGEGLDQADQLLEGLLVLARAQRGAVGDVTPVSLPGLVSGALEANRAEIAKRALIVENAMVPMDVLGNETLLGRMVANVMDNAVRHNVPGGLVHISNGLDGDRARLVVENGGAVLDQAQLAELGEPFRRLGPERVANTNGNGAGLGLSIVSAIAAAHGGVVAFHARPEGGLKVVVDIPATAAP